MNNIISQEEQDNIFLYLQQIIESNNLFQRLKYQDICMLGIDWNIAEYLFLFCIWIGDFAGAKIMLTDINIYKNCKHGPCHEIIALKSEIDTIYRSKSWKLANNIKKIYKFLSYYYKVRK
jgi:hypothetical protein